LHEHIIGIVKQTFEEQGRNRIRAAKYLRIDKKTLVKYLKLGWDQEIKRRVS
jgi:DNA-binding NtrC family response regulator